jgi:hypothetical protein
MGMALGLFILAVGLFFYLRNLRGKKPGGG